MTYQQIRSTPIRSPEKKKKNELPSGEDGAIQRIPKYQNTDADPEPDAAPTSQNVLLNSGSRRPNPTREREPSESCRSEFSLQFHLTFTSLYLLSSSPSFCLRMSDCQSFLFSSVPLGLIYFFFIRFSIFEFYFLTFSLFILFDHFS